MFHRIFTVAFLLFLAAQAVGSNTAGQSLPLTNLKLPIKSYFENTKKLGSWVYPTRSHYNINEHKIIIFNFNHFNTIFVVAVSCLLLFLDIENTKENLRNIKSNIPYKIWSLDININKRMEKFCYQKNWSR